MSAPTVEGIRQRDPIQVYYQGSDNLLEGYALYYDHDYAGSSDADTNVVRRNVFVEKGQWDNLKFFAGVVAPGQGRKVGPCWVSVVPVHDGFRQRVRVFTDENVAIGDPLGAIPGSYALGRPVVGDPLFVATEAADKSGTAGPVETFTAQSAHTSRNQWSRRIRRHYDDFYGDKTVGTSVDTSCYLLTGTSAAAQFVDSSTPSDQATAALRGQGILKLFTNTTNQANLTMNGEPWSLAAGYSLLYRVRCSMGQVAATSYFMAGVALAGSTAQSSGPNLDYLAFRAQDGALKLSTMKGSSTATDVIAAVATVAANTFNEMVFIARNRSATAGRKTIICVYNGVVTTVNLSSAQEAEFPDDQSLTFLLEILGNAGRDISIDEIEIVNAN